MLTCNLNHCLKQQYKKNQGVDMFVGLLLSDHIKVLLIKFAHLSNLQRKCLRTTDLNILDGEKNLTYLLFFI